MTDVRTELWAYRAYARTVLPAVTGEFDVARLPGLRYSRIPHSAGSISSHPCRLELIPYALAAGLAAACPTGEPEVRVRRVVDYRQHVDFQDEEGAGNPGLGG